MDKIKSSYIYNVFMYLLFFRLLICNKIIYVLFLSTSKFTFY